MRDEQAAHAQVAATESPLRPQTASEKPAEPLHALEASAPLASVTPPSAPSPELFHPCLSTVSASSTVPDRIRRVVGPL